MTVSAMGFEDFIEEMKEKYPDTVFNDNLKFLMLMAYVQGSNDDMSEEQGLQFAKIGSVAPQPESLMPNTSEVTDDRPEDVGIPEGKSFLPSKDKTS